MGLMDHDFHYCRTREQFHNTYSGLVSNLIGKKVIRLYGVWNQIDCKWSEDAPIKWKKAIWNMTSGLNL